MHPQQYLDDTKLRGLTDSLDVSEEPWQASEMDQQEPHEVPEGEMQSVVPGDE